MEQPYTDVLRACTAISYAALELHDSGRHEPSCFNVIQQAIQ
jgi:hypothetical protein